jgi:putative DNA primase/helicase
MTKDFTPEFCKDSAISPSLYSAAIETTDNANQEVYEALDRHISLNGHTVPHNFGDTALFLQSEGGVWMAKPSNPMVSGDGRYQKYLCPSGKVTGPYLPPIPQDLRSSLLPKESAQGRSLSFWHSVQADPSVPILITEGGKKSLSGLSHGLVSIALSGVDGWNASKGSKELHPELSQFAYGARVFMIAFDQDSAPKTRKRVARAAGRLARALQTESPDIQVFIVQWAPVLGKGLDDLLATHGLQALTEAMGTAKVHDPLCFLDAKGARKLNPTSKLSQYFANEWGDTLAYRQQTQTFYGYSEGLWAELSKEGLGRMIQVDLDATAIGYGSALIPGIEEGLKLHLSVERWKESKNIPFQNGVLNVDDRTLSPHCPENNFTWQLPYNYDPSKTCPSIEQWLLEAQGGSDSRVQVLRAYLRAVVTGASHLQRFLELIGPGGSGKSTFSTLAVALVGRSNVSSTSIQELETNRFSTSAIYGKKLVIIPDADGYNKSVSVFKAITGGDEISYERKHKDAREPFVFGGMVIYVANQPLASVDTSSGLARRRLTVPFAIPVAPIARRRLIGVDDDGQISGEFRNEIPGLMNWVLDMSEEQMTLAALGLGEYSEALEGARLETLCTVNPLALWVTEATMVVEGHKAAVGTVRELSITDNGCTRKIIDRADLDLYPNYVQFCRDRGLNAISSVRFKRDLVGLCREQLGITGVFDGGRSRLDCDSKISIVVGLMLTPKEARTAVSVPVQTQVTTEIATEVTTETITQVKTETITQGTTETITQTAHAIDNAMDLTEDVFTFDFEYFPTDEGPNALN